MHQIICCSEYGEEDRGHDPVVSHWTEKESFKIIQICGLSVWKEMPDVRCKPDRQTTTVVGMVECGDGIRVERARDTTKRIVCARSCHIPPPHLQCTVQRATCTCARHETSALTIWFKG